MIGRSNHTAPLERSHAHECGAQWDAEGATSPETLRQTDREDGLALESGGKSCPPKGLGVLVWTPDLSGFRTEGRRG